MTSPKRLAEVSQVDKIFMAALTGIGLRTLAESIQLWASVAATSAQVEATAAQWILQAIRHVGLRRRHARELAFAYFRLQRALHTGYTISTPGQPASQGAVTLQSLRDDFYEAVEQYSPEALEAPESPENLDDLEDQEPLEEPEIDLETVLQYSQDPAEQDPEPEQLIEVEDLDVTSEEEDQSQAEKDAEAFLQQLGKESLKKQLDEIAEEQAKAEKEDDEVRRKTLAEIDEERDEAHKKAGRRQASTAERLALNGARDLIAELANKDSRVIGYARVSTQPPPCGWCAMLISRGAVYKSAATGSRATIRAQHQAVGEQYHDNCRCIAIPVYSKEQFDDSLLFDLNRDYEQLWKELIKDADLGDEKAMTVWRRYFRRNLPMPSR